VEPSGAQGFEAWAHRPTSERREPIGAYPLVPKGVGVRDRSVEKRKKHVPAPLVRRCLIEPSADRGAELHLLQVYIHPGAAQLIGSGQGQSANWLDVGRGQDDDLFAVIAGAHQRLPNRRVVAWTAQDVDPGIVGKWRSGAEEPDAVAPQRTIDAGDRGH